MSFRAAFGLCLALCATCLASSARADTTTLTTSNQGAISGPTPTPLPFPITRSGDTTYPVVVSYHTVDGTAFNGFDYDPVSGAAYFSSGATNASVPVTLQPIPFGPPLTFQFKLDGAVGLGPDATFTAAQTFDLSGGAENAGLTAVAAGDLNGDGVADLAIAVAGPPATALVLLNTTLPGAASASLAPVQTFATDSNPLAIAIADFNGDGQPDLVLTSFSTSKICVLRNTTVLPSAATPSFAAQQTFAVGSLPNSLAVADFNGDGRPDVAVLNQIDTNISVLLNTTPPGSNTFSFAPQVTFAPTPQFPSALAAGDFNGDGKPDLVVTEQFGGVSVLLNTTVLPTTTTPSFAAPQDFSAGGSGDGITVADIDNDGRPDVIVGISDGPYSRAAVLLNATTPGSATLAFREPGAGPTAGSSTVRAADLNGDGKLDVIVPAQYVGKVSVLMNQTPFGALTGRLLSIDGGFDVSGGRGGAVADLNSDGRPDVAAIELNGDLSVLLNTTAPLGLATPQFAAQVAPATPQNSHAVVATDLNGDGRPDLAVAAATTGSPTVSVLLDTTEPCATPTFTTQQPFAVGVDPYTLVAADLNGDGRRDLVTANFSGLNVSALLNTTVAGSNTPTFTAKVDFATGVAGTFPQDIAATDLNGDGKLDLVVANFSNFAVLPGTTAPGAASPTFAGLQSFTLAGGVNAHAVAAIDVNGDGRPDVVIADYNAPGIKVFLNTTAPNAATITFAGAQSFASAASAHAFAIASADINLDGKPDVIVTNYPDAGPGPLNSVSVLLNTTVPGSAVATFSAQVSFATGDYPFSVTTADVDGDGRADVIVGNYFPVSPGVYKVSVLRNTTVPGAATPSLATQETFGVGATPYSVAAADFNGDGKPDLAVANASGFSTSVLLNAQYLCKLAGNPATGTITHDGVFHDGFE